MTWHSAFNPQVPGQGSLHLLFTHALVLVQSVLRTHSGRQPEYGSPKYSGRHVHEPAPLRSLQIALTPQGDGLHGFRVSIGISEIFNRRIYLSIKSQITSNFQIYNLLTFKSICR